jgi:hypothetical protein
MLRQNGKQAGIRNTGAAARLTLFASRYGRKSLAGTLMTLI